MKIPVLSLVFFVTISFSCNTRLQSTKKLMPDSTKDSNSATEIQKPIEIDGLWSLVEFSNNKIILKDLYPSRIPFIKINKAAKQISGNTSCNAFSGKLMIDGDKFILEEPVAMTQKSCAGEGEFLFLCTLKAINTYKISANNALELYSREKLLMSLAKLHD